MSICVKTTNKTLCCATVLVWCWWMLLC